MNYEEWTAKTVEGRILEAAETLMLCPNAHLGGGGSIWGEYKDDYGPVKTTYKKRPSGGAIDRMERVWTWINALPEMSDRKLIYAWSYVKVRKGLRLSAFAAENDFSDRTLKRQITDICQRIADNLNRLYAVRLTVVVDEVAENQPSLVPYNISSQKCAVTNWRSRDAKPTDRTHPDREELVKRLERLNARRQAQRVA
jgi:hypothetical protein